MRGHWDDVLEGGFETLKRLPEQTCQRYRKAPAALKLEFPDDATEAPLVKAPRPRAVKLGVPRPAARTNREVAQDISRDRNSTDLTDRGSHWIQRTQTMAAEGAEIAVHNPLIAENTSFRKKECLGQLLRCS